MPNRKPHKPRNYEIAKGIQRYSRSAMYRRSGRAAMKKMLLAKNKPWPKHESPKKEEKKRIPRYYPTDGVHTPLPRSRKQRPTKLRSSIAPGTILILLAGRFRGKRVIFLKQLPSGLLLITGPFKVNGVPLRRVNQAYVIATSTKVDISGLDIAAYTDDYFKTSKKSKQGKSATGFFEPADSKEKAVEEEFTKKKDNQKGFDKQVIALVSGTPNLRDYLGARFSLQRGQYPHDMNF